MKLLIGKLIICFYLCSLAYFHQSDSILQNSLKQSIASNLDSLKFHSKNRQFLDRYLLYFIYFALYLSIMTVLSKNMLPKILNSIGIILYMYFSMHPSAPIQMQIPRIAEHICIIGGLMYIGGSQQFNNSFGQQIKIEQKIE